MSTTVLSEKDRRRYAEAEVVKLGYGGAAYIARLFGCSRESIEHGVRKPRLRAGGFVFHRQPGAVFGAAGDALLDEVHPFHAVVDVGINRVARLE